MKDLKLKRTQPNLWTNLINRTIDIQQIKKNWKSMYKVNGELSPCDITYSGRVSSREGDIHNFAFLAQMSYCRPFSSVVRKLFTFSSSSWKRIVGF